MTAPSGGPAVPAPPLTLNAWLRYDVVSRLLPAEARTVLEIGCGQGGFGARLAADRDYLGVEPDGASYAVARSRLAELGRGEVRHGLMADVVEPDRRFDLVCAFEVLEHIEDDHAALREWKEHLAPGGHLLLSVPAFQHRFAAADVAVGHYRRYSPAELTTLLRGCGFTQVSTVLYGVPLGYALERARNIVLGRRMKEAAVTPGGASEHYTPATTPTPELLEQRSAGSGRTLQPSAALGWATQGLTAPFRRIQRAFPGKGTGLVTIATLQPTAH